MCDTIVDPSKPLNSTGQWGTRSPEIEQDESNHDSDLDSDPDAIQDEYNTNWATGTFRVAHHNWPGFNDCSKPVKYDWRSAAERSERPRRARG